MHLNYITSHSSSGGMRSVYALLSRRRQQKSLKWPLSHIFSVWLSEQCGTPSLWRTVVDKTNQNTSALFCQVGGRMDTAEPFQLGGNQRNLDFFFFFLREFHASSAHSTHVTCRHPVVFPCAMKCIRVFRFFLCSDCALRRILVSLVP